MHIAHVLRKYNPAEWGGTETAVKQLLDGLREESVGATVYAPRLAERPKRDPLAEAGHRLRPYRAFVPVLNLTDEQRALLISVGGNLMSFDLMAKLLRQRPLSVIHSHALNRIGGIAMTVAKIRRLPLVVTIHGGVLDLPKSVLQTLNAPLEGGYEYGKLFGALLRSRHVLKRANAIVTCNPREAALQREKFPHKRIIVQPHGVPVARYAEDHRPKALEAFPTLGHQKVLLIVGRIDPVKNQGWVLVQMPRILQEHPDCVLVIAGACTDELYGKALRKEVRRLGIESKVLFTGGLPPGDARLVGLMQTAAAVIVPSLSETFGLIILEGWAAGAPVLSTRTSGALALLRDTENGHLFDIDKPDSFFAAMRQVLTNPEHARRIAANGRELATAEYDSHLLSRRMKDLYEELMRER